MDSNQNYSNNSNSKRKNKKRKNRHQRNKNTRLQNGHVNHQVNIENQNCDSEKVINTFSSSPRPTGFNNFTFENKRCSGSEYEEFHTPNYEYPEISKNEIKFEIKNSLEDEWDELARFPKSNLEGIPEQDPCYNNRSHMFDGEKYQMSSSDSFKYKPIRNRKHKKHNEQKEFQSNKMCTNNSMINVDEVKVEEHVELVNGFKTRDKNVIIDDLPPTQSNENDDHKQNESEDNEPSVCSVIEINSLVKEDGENILNESVNCVEDKKQFSNNPEQEIGEKSGDIIECFKECSEVNAIFSKEDIDEKSFENEESIDNFVNEESFITNDYYFDEKIQEINEYVLDIPKSYFTNEQIENISTLNNGKSSFTQSFESELDNIHCTDENLEAEILKVSEFKSEIFLKPPIKKSMTLGARDLENSHRQSATTITNVTSISDENINLNYEADYKSAKTNKKRSKFVKIVLDKLKKRKINTKIEKTSSTEDQLVENNEYFDDASIDCNSHTKGQEIDSNKALKSYDESINNYGDSKQNEEHNEYENHFSYDNGNKLENIESLSQHNIIYDIKKEPNKFSTDEIPKRAKVSDLSTIEKKSGQPYSINCTKPEKNKKNKMFTLFNKKSNNNDYSNKKDNSKFVSKAKDDLKGNNFTTLTYNCNGNIEVSTKNELSPSLNKPEKLIIETNYSESHLNNTDSSTSPGEPLKSDFETLDQSFKFLNSFESSPVKEIINTENYSFSGNEKCLENDEKFEDMDFYLCPNVEDVEGFEEIPKKKKGESKSKSDQDRVDKNHVITNNNVKNKNPKEKLKKRFWTLFAKGKKKQSTTKARRKSWSYENIKDDNELVNEKVSDDKNQKLEDQHFSDFEDVYNSLNTKIVEKNETVVSKNKNDYPKKQIVEDVTNKEVVFENDDHLFPDSLTPTKILCLKPGEPYPFAFMDDPIILEQDKLTIFIGESKGLIFSEFCAPLAQPEMFDTSENSEETEISEKSKSPARIYKRPLSGLFGYLSRYR